MEEDASASAWCGCVPNPQAAEVSHYVKLLALSEDAMFSVLSMENDGACTILYCSPGVTRLLGYTPEEYLALGPIYMHEAVHPDDLERVLRDAAEARAAPPAWRTVRYREARKDATWADIESLYTTRGPLFYGITREATAARATEKALQELLLSTSFDLRCSATSIISASSLLRSRPAVMADAEAAELADAVRTSCDMLSGLASNALELRRLERGDLTVTRAPFNLRDTVRGVLQMCRMAKCSGAELAWEEAEELPPLVEGDTFLLDRIIMNLCTNALKFSNNSRVSVHVVLEPPAADAQTPQLRTLRVDVADKGVGVAPESLERIFEKYERAPQDEGGGAGLGLHLSRSFARAMGGDVTVQSALGEGSTFTLRVPVRVLALYEAAADVGGSAAACKADVPAPDLSERVRTNQAAGRHSMVDPFETVSLEEMVLQLLAETNEIFVFTKPLGREHMSRLAYVSPSVRTVLGYEPHELADKQGTWLLHPDDIEQHAAATAAMWAPDAPAVASAFGLRRVRRADGSYLWMHMQVYRVGDFYYALLRDATRFKEAQRSLKEYLLATSHDMRTPVTSIVTAAQLLEGRPAVLADSEAAFLVHSIKSCGRLMMSVISNVLQLRSLDGSAEGGAGSSKSSDDVLRPACFDPRALVDDVLAATCSAMGHSRVASCAPAPLPASVEADVERLQRSLDNITICVLRHSTDDRQLSIRLACGLACVRGGSAADDAAELQLDLCDPGRHVEADAAFDSMFTPYYSSKTADAGGLYSGLGLCVARVSAHAMGGSLHAERMAPPGALPSGIAFRLRVPVRVVPAGGAEAAVVGAARQQLKRAAPGDDTPSPPKAPAASAPTSVAGSAAPSTPIQKRILLVEDHELILKLVSKLLRNAGFEVSTAINGAEALQQLQAAAVLPDAVLTDIQMPIMDGWQLARAFRAWEATQLPLGAPRMPIIALSANVLEEHVQQSYDAGMTCHFSKPLRPEAVQELRRMLRCDV